MGKPSTTQDHLSDTESDDDVSSSVVAARKMAPDDNIINIYSWMQMDNMVPNHKFSNCTDQQVHDKLKEKHFALAKGWSMNSITTKLLFWFKTRSSIQGYQESSISAAFLNHQLSQRL